MMREAQFSEADDRRGEIGALAARHAVFWLVAANAVGVLLAAELVWPALGDALAPLTYGRWMPLHMNWQLYGWCSLPLVGVLLAWCADGRHPQARRHVSVALWAWSLALAAGGVSWLAGVSSGKLFLDWHGWARGTLSAAMVVLWTVCAAHAWWRRGAKGARGADLLRATFLGGLLFVPGLLYWSAGREVYPSVNPHSGGATGASLLGSTLGIVMIFGLLPVMLRVPARTDGKPKCHLLGDTLVRGVSGKKSDNCHLIGDNWVRGTGWYWWALAGSYGVFGVIDRGNASHHAWGQIWGLGLLIAWVPAAWVYFRSFEWDASARRWLAAAFAWWAALVASGFWSFLPGVSERLKFTNGLVAHAHLAMAGLVTAVNFAVLRQLAPRAEPRGNFGLWQGACAAHVGVLLILSLAEAENTGELFRSEAWTQGFYLARLAAGAAMLVASARWLSAERPRRFL